MSHKIIGIIPARLNSTRFPGKLLVPILGKTLIQRTFENAQKAESLSALLVATDHQSIFDHVTAFGGQVIMTSESCLNGSDRLAEVLYKHPEFLNADVIVNIQGDEPCLNPDAIDRVAQVLIDDPLAQMSTLVTRLRNEEEAQNSAIVKCVFDKSYNALYFSRALIPSNKPQRFNPDCPYYRHIGLYAYRPSFLLEYQKLQPTPLQLEEDLEQLKVLEHGYRIKVAVVKEDTIGVDKPEDIIKVESWLCKQNIYL